MIVLLSIPNRGDVKCELTLDPLRLKTLSGNPTRYIRLTCRGCGIELTSKRLNVSEDKRVSWSECPCGCKLVTRISTTMP